MCNNIYRWGGNSFQALEGRAGWGATVIYLRLIPLAPNNLYCMLSYHPA